MLKKFDDVPKEVVPKEVASVACRICKGGHFTSKCPHAGKGIFAEEEAEKIPVVAPAAMETTKAAPGKYVPRIMRERAADGTSGDSRDDPNSIRISNLSDSTREEDLRVC